MVFGIGKNKKESGAPRGLPAEELTSGQTGGKKKKKKKKKKGPPKGGFFSNFLGDREGVVGIDMTASGVRIVELEKKRTKMGGQDIRPGV